MGKKKKGDLKYTSVKNAWMGSYVGKGDERKFHEDMAKRLGMRRPKAVKNDGGKSTNSGVSARSNYGARIAGSMSNDYDVRRTLEAKALTGDKFARKYAEKGVHGIEDVYEVNNYFKEEHKKRGNNPDDFGSASDFAQITQAAVDDERKHQTKQYEKMFASKDFLNERLEKMKNKMKSEESEPVEYEESDELKNAKARLAGNTPGSEDTKSNDSMFKQAAPTERPTTAFRKANENAPTADDQKNAASYLEQYKLDIAKGAGLTENEFNIENAKKTVLGR